MAGSISLSLSQQFDELGSPLSGGRLHFIQAGTTSTPQNAFYDVDLTFPLPNPVILNAAGRVPAFYLADGQIKIRLTSATGVEQIVQDNILVIGPSSGGGGGGGVDPSVIFQTGDVMWLDVQGTRSGWVRDNGRTIGAASSGATERANADTSALYTFLYNNFPNTICPVSGGRGANAAADFAANKTIQLPNKQNAVAGGLDDMGATAAGGYSGVPVVLGDVTTAGSVLGENTHALTTAELATHSHANALNDPGHTHVETTATLTGPSPGISNNENASNTSPRTTVHSTLSSTTGMTITNANAGSGTAHNTVQKTVLGTWYRKL